MVYKWRTLKHHTVKIYSGPPIYKEATFTIKLMAYCLYVVFNSKSCVAIILNCIDKIHYGDEWFKTINDH